MRIALAQLAPVLLNRDATLARVHDAVDAAAADGARWVVFGESLVPGYPIWLSRTGGAAFEDPLQKALHARYLEQGVVVTEHLSGVQERAAQHGIGVILGNAERARDRAGHTLYCSAVTVLPDGRIGSVHRKLMPTHEERLCWGIGDGNGLVVHRDRGFVIGTLNCWENWMPLARVALQSQGETLHVAIWPGGARNTAQLTPMLAREGRSFAISVGGLYRPEDIAPLSLPGKAALLAGTPLDYDGGSCAAGPDGQWLLPPQQGVEGIFTVDLDPALVRAERQNFDPSGHYSRPDVFSLTVDRRRQGLVTFQD